MAQDGKHVPSKQFRENFNEIDWGPARRNIDKKKSRKERPTKPNKRSRP